MKEDPAVIVERVSRLIHGNIVRALNEFRLDKPLHTSKLTPSVSMEGMEWNRSHMTSKWLSISRPPRIT